MKRIVRALIFVFVILMSGNTHWFTRPHAYAGSPAQTKDLSGTHVQSNEPSRIFRYRADHYRDPFLPKSVFQDSAGSSLQGEDVSLQTVKVVGLMSSAQGRWAMLEFEDGERLIVRAGQIISSYSQVVKRITDQGITLSAIKGKAGGQPEKTYLLYEEQDVSSPYPGGSS